MTAIFPEGLLVSALSAALDGIPVSGDVPKDRPSTFVTVERTGGARDLFLDNGTYAVQCWAPTRAKAATLATRVSDVIVTLPASSGRVGGTTVASLYNFPDPDSGQARYQITATAVVTVN